MSSQNAAVVPAPSDPVAGIGDGVAGILNVFVDPAATARRVTLRWFWIYPFIVSCAVTIYYSLALRPYTLKVAEAAIRERGTVSPEQVQTALSMTRTFSTVAAFAAPVFIVVVVALSAWLIGVAASMTDVKTRFRDLFSLVMVAGMIPMLQIIGNLVVLRSKSIDDIQSPQDLQPPFGLDIFVHDLPKVLMAVLHFFSIFQIWTIVVMALLFAAMAKTTKGKGFFATSPAWLLGLIFAIIGGLFQR